MKRVFATPADAEAAFYAALEKNQLEPMMEVWSEDDEIVCVHPGGPRLTGYEAVRESWARIFASGQRLRIRLSEPVQMISGMIAVHSVHENFLVADDRAQAAAVATNIYIRTASGWRMLAHHSSPVPAAPQSRTVEAPKTLH